MTNFYARDSRMIEEDERHNRNRSLSRNRNTGNNNGNGNGNGNNNSKNNLNGWQWLSIFLLVYSLSLQLGVFDTIKSSIGQSLPIISNEFELLEESSIQSRSRHHTRKPHRQKRNLVEEEVGSSSSSTSSSSFSKSDMFKSLEARHEHHLARRKAPPEHMLDRTGPSSSGIITNDGFGVKMHNSHDKFHHPAEKQQHRQQSRREMQTEDDVDTTNATTSIENISANSSDSSNSSTYSTTTSNPITSIDGRLRAKILNGYDRNAYPWEWAWEQDYNNSVYDREGDRKQEVIGNITTNINGTAITTTIEDAEDEKKEHPKKFRVGLPVEFGLNFHKVHSLNVAESTADLVVWVRMKWRDPRLQWNPEDHNGLKTTWFYISEGIGGGESSEIWTPDIYLWNQEEAMAENLANTYATVSSDGSIFWSRPGRIKSTCKYDGLENFPFDKLGCRLEFGSWSHSGLYLRPIKLGGTGYTIGGSETAGGSFVEFELVRTEIIVDEVIYPPFDCCPEEDWPVIIYTLKFDRASAPYVRSVVLINILLNFAAFACFWIPPNAGERIGLAITCVLAAVAGELVVASMLPICSELSWYNKFTLGSTSFALLAVFQSALAIFLFYYTGEDLTPTYIKWIKRKFNGKKRKIIEKKERKQLENGGMMSPPSEERQEKPKTTKTSIAGMSRKGGMDIEIPKNNDNGNSSDGDDALPDDAPFQKGTLKRNNFSNSHDNGNGNVPHRNYLASTRSEWMSQALGGAGTFKNEKEVEMNLQWQIISGYIDEGARIIIPILYLIFLGWVFGIKN